MQFEEFVKIILRRNHLQLVQKCLFRRNVPHKCDHILKEFFILQLMNIVDLLDCFVNIFMDSVYFFPTLCIFLSLLIVQLLEFFK